MPLDKYRITKKKTSQQTSTKQTMFVLFDLSSAVIFIISFNTFWGGHVNYLRIQEGPSKKISHEGGGGVRIYPSNPASPAPTPYPIIERTTTSGTINLKVLTDIRINCNADRAHF